MSMSNLNQSVRDRRGLDLSLWTPTTNGNQTTERYYVACMGGELEEGVVWGMSVIKGAQVSSWLIMRLSAPCATFRPSVFHCPLVCVKGFTIGW